MPFPQPMGYIGRPMNERTPHQVATALAGVLKAFAHATGHERFDVLEHPDLIKALNEAGIIFLDAVTPGNPPHRGDRSGG